MSVHRPSKSSSASYAEPHYVLLEQATAILSEVRRISAHPNVLTWLNTFLDELLFSTLSSIAAAAGANGVSGRPGTPSAAIQLPLTTEKYKTDGLLRLHNNSLIKAAILEAELVTRELLREGGREWRSDSALRSAPPVPGNPGKEVKALFEELRVEIEMLSPLGASVTPQPGQALAMYCATVLAHIGETVLRRMARIIERDAGRGEAKTAELFAAMAEDDSLWKCFEGMRTRTYIERDLSATQKTAAVRTSRPGTAKSSLTRSSNESRGEINLSSTSSFLKRKASRGSSISSKNRPDPLLFDTSNASESAGSKSLWDSLDQQDEFENLLAGQGTMKVSLTPNRLKSMELFTRSRSRKVPHPVNTGEDKFSKPKASSQLSPIPSPYSDPVPLPRTPSDVAHSPSPSPIPALPMSAAPDMPNSPALLAAQLPKSPRMQARPAVRTRNSEGDDDAYVGIAKETLADFFASNPAPPSTESDLVRPSGSDQAEVDAKIAANRARRQAKQSKSSELDLDAPPIYKARSQPDLLTGSPTHRKRFTAKEAAPRENSNKDLMDFLSSSPPPRVASPPAIEEVPAARMTRSRGLADLLPKRAVSENEERVSPPVTPTSQKFAMLSQRIKSGITEVGTSARSSISSKHGRTASAEAIPPAPAVGNRVVVARPTSAQDAPFTSLNQTPLTIKGMASPTLVSVANLSSSSTSTDNNSFETARPFKASPIGSKIVNGLMTPDSSIEDIAGATGPPLPPKTEALRADTPPETPVKAKRVPAPSAVLSTATDAEETLLTPADTLSVSSSDEAETAMEPSEAESATELKEAVVEVQSKSLQPNSEVAQVLLDLRERMLLAPAEKHLAILEAALAAFVPVEETRDPDMAAMESRVVESFLSGDYESTSLPVTPSLTDNSDEDSHPDELKSPASVDAKELAESMKDREFRTTLGPTTPIAV